jgi:hypothetical protein
MSAVNLLQLSKLPTAGGTILTIRLSRPQYAYAALAEITMAELKDVEDAKSNKRSHSEYTERDGSGM